MERDQGEEGGWGGRRGRWGRGGEQGWRRGFSVLFQITVLYRISIAMGERIKLMVFFWKQL